MPSERQIRGQNHPSDGNAVQGADMVSHRRKHPLNLMVFSFMQADDSIISCHIKESQLRRQALCSVAQNQTLSKALCIVRLGVSCKADEVILRHMALRGKHPMGKLTVIGEQDKSGAVRIQSACGKESLHAQLLGEQFEDSPMDTILRGTDIALWFVDKKEGMRLSGQDFAAAGNCLYIGIHLAAAVAFGDAVHLNGTPFQDCLHIAARMLRPVGEQLIQSDLSHKTSVLFRIPAAYDESIRCRGNDPMNRYLKYLLILPPIAVCAAAVILSHGSTKQLQDIRTETEQIRLEWLASQGLQAQPLSSCAVTVPQDFSGIYEDYAALQSHLRLPLQQYAGQRAVLYTYVITDTNPVMYAELLTAQGRLIGVQCYHPEEHITLDLQGRAYDAE